MTARIVLAVALAVLATTTARAQERHIGSKAFTESVVLGEMLRHLAESTGAQATHHQQLGGTRVLWDALLLGEIDI